MKKLLTFVAVAALAVGGCKKKRDTETKDDQVRPPAEEPKPAPKPDDKAAKPDEPKAGVPEECAAYKALVDKLPACEKLPQTAKDALKTTYDNAAKAWAAPPTDDNLRKQIAETCRQNTEALRGVAASGCGW